MSVQLYINNESKLQDEIHTKLKSLDAQALECIGEDVLDDSEDLASIFLEHLNTYGVTVK